MRAKSDLVSAGRPLATWPVTSVEKVAAKLEEANSSLKVFKEPIVSRASGELTRLTAKLDALSPLASLSRGYAVVKNTADDSIVKEASQAPEGSRVDVTLAKGHLLCEVKESKDV